jgi:homogentisate phytyltransferase/homogentisate geranylgeranyltransferase
MMIAFTTVISLFKDIPDIEGDKKHDVHTLSVKLGSTVMIHLCVGILFVAYASFFLLGALNRSFEWNGPLVSFVHGALALTVLARHWALDHDSKSAVVQFYMFIWKLFYLEYLIFPLMVLWRFE